MVKYALCTLEVEVVLGIFSPRKVCHCLEIVILYAVLRALRIKHIQLVKLLSEYLVHLFRPSLALSLLLKVLAFWRTFASAKFLLNVLDLLLQEVFALLLVEILACL